MVSRTVPRWVRPTSNQVLESNDFLAASPPDYLQNHCDRKAEEEKRSTDCDQHQTQRRIKVSCLETAKEDIAGEPRQDDASDEEDRTPEDWPQWRSL